MELLLGGFGFFVSAARAAARSETPGGIVYIEGLAVLPRGWRCWLIFIQKTATAAHGGRPALRVRAEQIRRSEWTARVRRAAGGRSS